MKTTLNRVPHFVFYQDHEEALENTLIVRYYNGTIEIEQGGDSIILCPEKTKSLFAEIERHKKEAENLLNK